MQAKFAGKRYMILLIYCYLLPAATKLEGNNQRVHLDHRQFSPLRINVWHWIVVIGGTTYLPKYGDTDIQWLIGR